MIWDTATPLEMIRTAIALAGVVATFCVLFLTVSDASVLQREGVNGPTTLVYTEKILHSLIGLVIEVAYTLVGITAMLTPEPAAPVVSGYVNFAVAVSIAVTTLVLLGAAWGLRTRTLLAESLRRRTDSQQVVAQAQQDRIEATGQDTNDRIRSGDIGRDENAVVSTRQATRIEATGEESLGRLRREGIGDDTDEADR